MLLLNKLSLLLLLLGFQPQVGEKFLSIEVRDQTGLPDGLLASVVDFGFNFVLRNTSFRETGSHEKACWEILISSYETIFSFGDQFLVDGYRQAQ